MFLNPEQLQRSNQYAQGLLDMSQGPVVGMLNQSYTGSGIGDAILAYLGDAVTGKNFQAGMDRLDQLAQMGITGDLPDEMPDIAYDMMPGGGVLSVGGRLAKTANLEMLDIAKDATEKGMSKEKIFDATGWWKGADDKWRFEIDDSAATVGDGVRKMKYSQYDNMRKLPEMLDNPNVRAAYPEYYDDIEVYKGAWGDDSMGSMSEQGYMMWLHPEVLTKAGRKSANRVMHHELNHGVSHQEGFARGGSTAEFGKELSKKKKRAGVAVTMVNDRLSNISKKMDRLREKMYDKGVNTVEVQREIDGLNNIYRELLEQRQSYVKDAQIDLLIDPYDSYRRLVDEVQARNVEHRLPLSADDRRMLPPWLTEDVPLEKQIVRFGDGDSMSTGILGDTLKGQRGAVGVDDLPMDEASRMARAREMGFTDKLYHQTSPDAQKAILDDGFDTTILGAREGETLLPDGVYTKTNADDIGLHKNATQMELMVSPGNKAEYIDRAGLESHLMYDPEYSKLKTSWGKRDAQYANEFDDAFNKGFKSDADFDESERVTREILDRWQAEQKETAAKLRDRATKFLQSEGYDSVRVRRDAGSLGRQADTTVIFDPSRIRSPNAKFDPSKKNSKNLLDSLYPAGIGMGLIGGGLLSQDEQYY